MKIRTRLPTQQLTSITFNNRGYKARPEPVANGILRLDKTKKEMAEYLSAALFSPDKSTLLRAIRKEHLLSWPGLTTSLISKHLPKQVATSKGHLDQEFKNIRSTKNISPYDKGDPDDDIEPPPRTP